VIIIEAQAVAPFYKNGFVVACPRTRAGVLIDPGDEVDGLLEFIAREGIGIAHILLTHAHIDHVTGVAAAKRALGVAVHLHRDDLFLYERVDEQAKLFGVGIELPPPAIDSFYGVGERIPFGEFEARLHHTPGHSPGGVCIEVARPGERGRDLFVGDTLFAGSIGRTDLPGGDHATLLGSIRAVLFTFDDDARVYPGHGPDTTIGRERHDNPYLQVI
jgi:glyoxylase-like metal-dependent hydrolase (beta-lactamase superfamily II)